MKKVLLFSGGMDSLALKKIWNPDVSLYVDVGSRYSKQEIERLPKDVVVFKLEDLGSLERSNAIIPLRNLFFICIASNYGNQIALGATKDDRVLDKTFEFADKTTDLLSYLWREQWWTEERKVSVELPVKHLTKSQIIKTYLEAGGLLEDLAKNSFSCYEPVKNKECGTCKPCVRKWLALIQYGHNFSETSEDYCHKVYSGSELEVWKTERPNEASEIINYFSNKQKK